MDQRCVQDLCANRPHAWLTASVLFEQEEERVSLHMDGEPEGDTAMAKLVGKPVAIAAKMIISGERSQ